MQHQGLLLPSSVNDLASSNKAHDCSEYCQQGTEMARHLSKMYHYHSRSWKSFRQEFHMPTCITANGMKQNQWYHLEISYYFTMMPPFRLPYLNLYHGATGHLVLVSISCPAFSVYKLRTIGCFKITLDFYSKWDLNKHCFLSCVPDKINQLMPKCNSILTYIS